MSAFDVQMIAIRSTTADVLSRHGITVDDRRLHTIAFNLWMASDPEAGSTKIREWRKREHEARRVRIDKLDAVIDAYRERIESIERADSLMEASYLSRDHLHNLGRMMLSLQRVRETEVAAAADWTRRVRSRPTGAKNAFATQIYRWGLRGSGLNRNQKCLVIADLLIAAGVADPPRERVQASLVQAIRNKGTNA